MMVPFCISADAYSISSEFFASPEAKSKSVYNLTNRYSPKIGFPEVAKDDRMVFFGLSEYIRRYLSKPITEQDIIDSAQYMETAHSFGGQLPFPKDLWYRVLKEYNGYIPIKIEALSEGSCFFPNEPYIQVTSFGEGFGELCAHIEAGLVGMVSNMTARVTLERHLLQFIVNWMIRDGWQKENVYSAAQFMIHDFGMRASSTLEESEVLGLCHLLCFHGTDTFNSGYLARQLGGSIPTGTSILALAHRNVMAFNLEENAFHSMHNAGRNCGTNINSYLLDTYNTAEALKYVSQLATDNPLSTFVCRCDSGDYVENTLNVCRAAQTRGLFNVEKNRLLSARNLRWINGDSMNPEKIDKIFTALETNGFSPTRWGIFGIGGYLRNTPNRDSLSSAYKISACGKENRPLVKLSEVRSKMSVPGPNFLRRFKIIGAGYDMDDFETQPTVVLDKRKVEGLRDYYCAYHTYYAGGAKCTILNETFDKKQKRCIEDFDAFAGVNPIILDDEILEIQQQFFDKYRN